MMITVFLLSLGYTAIAQHTNSKRFRDEVVLWSVVTASWPPVLAPSLGPQSFGKIKVAPSNIAIVRFGFSGELYCRYLGIRIEYFRDRLRRGPCLRAPSCLGKFHQVNSRKNQRCFCCFL